MAFSVTFNEAGFIHAVYEGELDMPGIKGLMNTVGLAVKEHDCYLVLSDYSKATMAISIADLYDMPKLVLQRGKEMGVSVFKIKRALVIPAAAYEKFHFFETVSLNNSQTVKIFTDEAEAGSGCWGNDPNPSSDSPPFVRRIAALTPRAAGEGIRFATS